MIRITFGGRKQYLNQMPQPTKFYEVDNFVENKVGEFEPIKNVIRKRINVWRCWMQILTDPANIDEDLLIHDDDIIIPNLSDFEFGDRLAYIAFVILKRQEVSLEPYLSRWSTCLFVPKTEQGKILDIVRRYGKHQKWKKVEFDWNLEHSLGEVGALWIDGVTHIAHASTKYILDVPRGRQYSPPMHTWESDLWTKSMDISYHVESLILPAPELRT